MDRDLLEDLIRYKCIPFESISNAEYSYALKATNLDFRVFKLEIGDFKSYSYQYIKIKKEDLQGEAFQTALLLLANIRQKKLEKQVGCLYIYLLFIVISTIFGFIIMLLGGGRVLWR